MSLILYAQSVFGMLFVIRTLQIFRARAVLSTKIVTKIGTAFVTATFTLMFFGAREPWTCIFLNFVALVIALASLFVAESRQIQSLKKEIPLFLDRWILNLRLGSALPTARDAALAEQTAEFRLVMQPVFLLRNDTNTTHHHLLFNSAVLHELKRLTAEPHSALSRLESLRKMLRMMDEFRRKSGQAVQQTRLQAAVMWVLLFALTIFTIQRFGWKRSADLIAISQLLSLVGMLAMYFLARKSKWKV